MHLGKTGTDAFVGRTSIRFLRKSEVLCFKEFHTYPLEINLRLEPHSYTNSGPSIVTLQGLEQIGKVIWMSFTVVQNLDVSGKNPRVGTVDPFSFQ